MKKKHKILALFLCGALLLSGCGTQATETVAEDDDQISIGLCFDSYVIERWVRDRDVFVSTAESLGATVNVQCANGDLEEQIDQIRYLIQQKVDVLVVIPVDCGGMSAVLTEARNAGIKVISYDRLIENGKSDLYVSFDNEEVGRIMGENMLAALPEGADIFMIGGPLTDDNVIEVEKGFHDVIDGHLNVVYTERCEGWEATQAQQYMQEALAMYPNVAGIMCGNDDIATQVFQVLSEQQLAGKVALTGQDGDLMACQRVVAGTQVVSVFKSVEEEARVAAEYAVKLANGEELTDISQTISDGQTDVPCLELQPVGLTKDSIDGIIIDGGYHTREEIYQTQETDETEDAENGTETAEEEETEDTSR